MQAAQKSWTEQLELWVTLGLCSLLLAIALLATKSVVDLTHVADLQALSHLRIAALTRIVSLLESAQSHRYAELVAGYQPDLPRDAVAREELARELSELRRLTSGDAGQSANARVLEILAGRQLERLGKPVGGVVRSGPQPEFALMQAVRAIASAMERAEQDSLAARSGQGERQRVRLLAALWFLTAVALLATLGAAWQLHRDVGRLRRDERTLLHAAMHDALTGLSNRRYFAQSLRRAFRECQDSGQPLALVAIDIDHFKQINDSLGHGVGDLVLRALAARLSDGFRDVDTIARVGGEEFAVILRGPDRDGAYQVADRVRAAIAAHPINPGGGYKGDPVAVTVSMGVAIVAPDAANIPALMDAADRALYGAKQTGRNRVVAAGGSPRRTDLRLA
jgi:diguanylate cyclase (GGDEF)-like protein